MNADGGESTPSRTADLAQQLQRSLDQAKATDARLAELAMVLHQRAA